MAMSSTGVPFVAFVNNIVGSSTYHVSVATWGGTSWSLLGGASAVSAGGAFQLAIALDTANLPIVAYRDSVSVAPTSKWTAFVMHAN